MTARTRLRQPGLFVGVVVGQHVGLVDAGQRLVLRVLEQAGRPDGQGIADLFQVGGQAALYLRGEGGGREAPLDLGVVVGGHGEVAQVVLFQEVIEDVGGEHQAGRHGYLHARELVGHAEVPQQMAHEGQSPGLAAQRSLPDAGEAVVGVERARVEVAHRLPGLLAPVGVDLVDQVAAAVFGIGVVGGGAGPEVMGQVKLGPRLQPAGEVVALGVKGDGLHRDRAQQLEAVPRGFWPGRPRSRRAGGR